jgi:mono/diheme cytochrome c family protein
MQKLAFATLLTAAASTAAADEVTYNKHIAPILWKHCADCHRPGAVAPFPLLTYKDAAKRADFLREVTAAREMPPWKPEPGYGDFHDARRLSDAELTLLARWARGGVKEGDPRDLPAPPVFPRDDAWRLRRPDVVVTMPRPFTVPAGGSDIYRCFVIPSHITQDRVISAIEFRPGNRRVVHHAVFFLDNWGQARAREAAHARKHLDAEPGYPVYGGLGGLIPTGDLGTWVPGMTPRRLPADVGMSLKKDADVIMQIHYHPSGKEETDQSSLALYFNANARAKPLLPIPLVNFDLRIPAGAERHRLAAAFTLPADVRAVAIQPHMHNLGREMKVTAVLPDGAQRPLIWIKDWNFNWQDRYLFKEFVPLPRGTRLECEAFYDNSAGNSLNPNHPPREVRWGEATTEEMLLCPVYVVADRPEDYARVLLRTAAIPGLMKTWYFEQGGGSLRPASVGK